MVKNTGPVSLPPLTLWLWGKKSLNLTMFQCPHLEIWKLIMLLDGIAVVVKWTNTCKAPRNCLHSTYITQYILAHLLSYQRNAQYTQNKNHLNISNYSCILNKLLEYPGSRTADKNLQSVVDRKKSQVCDRRGAPIIPLFFCCSQVQSHLEFNMVTTTPHAVIQSPEYSKTAPSINQTYI